MLFTKDALSTLAKYQDVWNKQRRSTQMTNELMEEMQGISLCHSYNIVEQFYGQLESFHKFLK